MGVLLFGIIDNHITNKIRIPKPLVKTIRSKPDDGEKQILVASALFLKKNTTLGKKFLNICGENVFLK